MSPQSLTDDELIEQLKPSSPTTPRADAGAAAPVEEAGDARLTVRELQLAIEAARTLAGRGSRPSAPPPSPAVGEGGADRSRAAPCHDALEGKPPVTPPIVAPAPPPSSPPTPAPAATDRPSAADATAGRTRPEPWLPEHDGPVSLAGAAAPRTRTVRRPAAATPDKASRRSATQRSTARAPQTAALEPALAAAAIAAPPRLIVVAACGGAGTTTATVLLAAALAQATGALLLAGGADRGSLSVRANSSGGDVAALTAWARTHPGQALQPGTPGMASGNAGTEQLVLAAAGRDDPGQPFDGDTAALLTAAASTRGSVLLDWSSPAPPPPLVWSSVTHVLVVAPATSPGLLDAEYLVQSLDATRPARIPLSVLTIDVRGRAPRRTGRAALARLQALRLPVTALPYDPILANDPRVHWPALRRRTRSAVVAALATVVHADPHPDQYREDES